MSCVVGLTAVACTLRCAGVTRPAAVASHAPPLHLPGGGSSAHGLFYVDGAGGNDAAAGHSHAPFKTIQRALVATRARASPSRLVYAEKSIVLKPGVHCLVGA